MNAVGLAAGEIPVLEAQSALPCVRRILPTIDPQEVQIVVAWPDGDNRPNSRVHVQLAYRHEFIVGLGLNSSGINLSAESILPIVN